MIVHLLPRATVHVCYEWNMTACSIPLLQPSVDSQQPKKIPPQNVPWVHVLGWRFRVHFRERQSEATRKCALFFNNLFTLLWLLLSDRLPDITHRHEAEGMGRENCSTNVLVHCLPFGGTSWASVRACSLPRGYVGCPKCLWLDLPLALLG